MMGVLASLVVAAAGGPMMNDGVRLFSEGRYPEAANAFGDAGASGEALYGRACALMEAGQLIEAGEAFRRVDREHPAFSARARFNLGHVLYRRSQAGPTPDADGAVEPPDVLGLLRQSAAAFRSVLEVDGSDVEAARNTEIVRRMIRDLEQQQERQRQRQQEMQNAADQLDRLADRQEDQAQENRNTPPSRAQEQRQKQQELMEETAEQLQSLADQANEMPEGEEAQESLREALREQAEALEDLAEQRPDWASEDQQSATDRLREAAQRLREAAEQRQQDEGDSRPSEAGRESEQSQTESQPEAPPKSPEEQQAERIIEAEQQNRDARERIRRMLARPVPVERDW